MMLEPQQTVRGGGDSQHRAAREQRPPPLLAALREPYRQRGGIAAQGGSPGTQLYGRRGPMLGHRGPAGGACAGATWGAPLTRSSTAHGVLSCGSSSSSMTKPRSSSMPTASGRSAY